VAAGDPLAAASIAVLAGEGLAPAGAEALLRDALPAATDTFLVRVAQALHALTGDESFATPVAAVLTSEAFWGVRIDAALALTGFAPTAELVAALGRGVRDDEYLVRYHSANTLRRHAGRRGDVSDNKTLFGMITSTDRARWAEAADRLTGDAL
jgi:hypothetical protein